MDPRGAPRERFREPLARPFHAPRTPGGLAGSGRRRGIELPLEPSGARAAREPVDTLCEKRCACQGDTSDGCVDACGEEMSNFVQAAGAQNCESQAQALLDCASMNFVCEEGDPPPLHGCWQEDRAYVECLGAPVPVGQGPEGAGGAGGSSSASGLPAPGGDPPGLPTALPTALPTTLPPMEPPAPPTLPPEELPVDPSTIPPDAGAPPVP